MPNIFELIKSLRDQAVSNAHDVQKQCHILHRGVERLIILTVREEQSAENHHLDNEKSQLTNQEAVEISVTSKSNVRSQENPWTQRRQSLIRALAQSSVVTLSYAARRDILFSALNLVLKSGTGYIGSIAPATMPERALASSQPPSHGRALDSQGQQQHPTEPRLQQQDRHRLPPSRSHPQSIPDLLRLTG